MTTLADFDGHEALMAGIAAADLGRLLVAVAGPPGAGKSSFAESLTQALNSAVTNSAAVIPMDGFHYDDAVLESRRLLGRKGAPATFDFGGLRHLLLGFALRTRPRSQCPCLTVFSKSQELAL